MLCFSLKDLFLASGAGVLFLWLLTVPDLSRAFKHAHADPTPPVGRGRCGFSWSGPELALGQFHV